MRLVACLLLLCATGPGLVAEEHQALTLTIEGVLDLQGQVVVQIYDSPETFLDEARAIKKTIPLQRRAKAGPIDLTLKLKPGRYAIAAFHDRNGNGQIDRNLIGLPEEPYGWTNECHPKWAAPSWAVVEVVVRPGQQARSRITIRDW